MAGASRSARPADEVLLDRLAIAAAAVLERYGPAHTTMADPALVELAISGDDQAARARALRLLGFAASSPLHVAAVRSALPLDQVAGLVCPSCPVKSAPSTAWASSWPPPSTRPGSRRTRERASVPRKP